MSRLSAARQRFATAMGIWIHKGLEAHARAESLDLEAFWRRVIFPLAADDELARQAFHEAQAELAAAIADPSWRELLADAHAIHPEMAFVHLSGDHLVRGSMDLCVERSDGSILVVDYKTTGVTAAEERSLERLAREKGYFAQLALYVAGARALFPGKNVAGSIFFTACRGWVPLS